MKYVRRKSGNIDFIPEGENVGEGEVIFDTTPSQFEGTWESQKENVNTEEMEVLPAIDSRGEAGGMSTPKPAAFYQHADIVEDGRGGITVNPELGGYVGTAAERKKLGYDPEKRLKYHQAKAIQKEHVCLYCGKKFTPKRKDAKFCCNSHRNMYNTRIRRKEAKRIKDFVPHRGKEGQIFFLAERTFEVTNLKGKNYTSTEMEVDFIPMLWADTWKKADNYVKTNYPKEKYEEIMKQVEKVMPKGGKI